MPSQGIRSRCTPSSSPAGLSARRSRFGLARIIGVLSRENKGVNWLRGQATQGPGSLECRRWRFNTAINRYDLGLACEVRMHNWTRRKSKLPSRESRKGSRGTNLKPLSHHLNKCRRNESNTTHSIADFRLKVSPGQMRERSLACENRCCSFPSRFLSLVDMQILLYSH